MPCGILPQQPTRAFSWMMAPKAQVQGTLFRYGQKSVQVAFRSGDFKKQVIFIGGLTDGLLATEYVVPLASALQDEKWSLVQPLLSSSYSGYGTSSLKQDSAELEHLLHYLIDEEESEGVMLIGHSTGCQDIVHYLKNGSSGSRAVRGAILQAPVSDREYRASLPDSAQMLDLADSLIKVGRGQDLMPREANPDAPITAVRPFKAPLPQFCVLVGHFFGLEVLLFDLLSKQYRRLQSVVDPMRYRSLCGFLGDDDMFSSDLSNAQLKNRLGHMERFPCQVIFSMMDEYVPEYVDKKALVQRLCDAMGGAEKVEIQHGNHSLSNRVQDAVHAIVDFVRREGPKGWDDPWRSY